MQRILILAPADPLRSQLVEAVARTGTTEAVLVADDRELIARVSFGTFAAVFADGDLLTSGAARLVDAVKSAIVRPMVVIASNEKAEDLDPEWITLVVHKPYDVLTVTGVLLSAIVRLPPSLGSAPDRTSVC